MDDDRESRDGRLCEITMDGRTFPACTKRPKQHVVFEVSRHYIHAWRCHRHRGTHQACEPTRWSEKRRLEFDVDRTPCPAVSKFPEHFFPQVVYFPTFNIYLECLRNPEIFRIGFATRELSRYVLKRC
jgi:hypothetical protein